MVGQIEGRSTEQKLKATELIVAEARSLVKMGHWEYDCVSGRLLWSDEQYRIYGYEPGELDIDDKFFYLKTTHPDDIPRIEAVIKFSMENKQPYTFDRRIIRKDGSMGYAQTSGKVICENDKVVRIVGVTLDITERKKTELLLSGVLNSSISGIEAFRSIRDGQNKIIDFEFILMNAVAERFKGKKAVDIIGKTMIAEYPYAFKSGLFESFVRVVEENLPLNIEHKYKGSKELYLKLIAVKHGDGFVLTFEDITDKKKLEQERAELKFKQQEEIVKTILKTQEEERKRVADALHISFAQLLNLNNYSNPNLSALSKREIEVLKLIADGLTNGEIAEKLFTGKRTIETHRKNILEKTGVKNTAALIKYAIINGIIKV